jgi:hypothetical protein
MSWYRGFLSTYALFCAAMFASVPALAAADPPQSSTVFITAGYLDNNVFIRLEEGSGFIIHPLGWVVTAKHLTQVDVPEGKTRAFFGAVASRTEGALQLFEVAAPTVSADIALLRFSPALQRTWKYLKVLSNHPYTANEKITAMGFPLGKEIEVRPGVVSALLGPKGAIGVNAGLAPGMSGGPVLLGASGCVLGIIAGGSGYPNYDYFTPTQLAKPLLDVPPAEYVTELSVSKEPPSSASTLFDRSFRVDQTKDDHQMSKSSKYYEFPFKANPGAKIVTGRLVEESANSADDKSLNISGDRTEAVFRFKLESGPVYDQWRGWWHGQVVLTQRNEQNGQQDALEACSP